MAKLLSDLRYAFRQLGKSTGLPRRRYLCWLSVSAPPPPSFFTVEGVLLRPLPFSDAHNLVVLLLAVGGSALPAFRTASIVPMQVLRGA